MPLTRITKGQASPATGSRFHGAVEAGRVGDRRGHGQHAAVAQGSFQQGGPAVEIRQHHAHAGRRRFQFPIAEHGGGIPGDFADAAAEFGEDGMLQRPRGEVDVAVGTPRLAQQLARQQRLRGGDVEGIDRPRALRPRKTATPCPSAAYSANFCHTAASSGGGSSRQTAA